MTGRHSAFSLWKSGRGYPGIESLKAISAYFAISIDELLSGKELMSAAEQDNRQKISRIQDIVFGLLDCAAVSFLHEMFGVHMWLYTITDWAGVAAILIALGFSALGLVQ